MIKNTTITKHDTLCIRESPEEYEELVKKYKMAGQVVVERISAKKAKKKVAECFAKSDEGSDCKRICRQLLSNRNIWNIPIYETNDMSYITNGVNLSTNGRYQSYVVRIDSEKYFTTAYDGKVVYTHENIFTNNSSRKVNDLYNNFSFVIMSFDVNQGGKEHPKLSYHQAMGL